MKYYPAKALTRVPFFTLEQLEEYKRLNVIPHKGTAYGDAELLMFREMRLANSAGQELYGVPDNIEPLILEHKQLANSVN